MSCISTMLEHHRRWGHREFYWDPDCLICGLPDSRTHAWTCSGLTSVIELLTAGLREWLRVHLVQATSDGPGLGGELRPRVSSGLVYGHEDDGLHRRTPQYHDVRLPWHALPG